MQLPQQLFQTVHLFHQKLLLVQNQLKNFLLSLQLFILIIVVLKKILIVQLPHLLKRSSSRAVLNYLSKRKLPIERHYGINACCMAAIPKFSCRSSPRTTFADCLFSFTPVSIKLYGLNGLKNLITVTIYKI